MQKPLNRSRHIRRRGSDYVRRAVDGFTLVLMHELDAIAGHLAEARERLAVARQCRDLGELLRTQVDLLPETRARLTLDWQERRALLRSWVADLRSGLKAAA